MATLEVHFHCGRSTSRSQQIFGSLNRFLRRMTYLIGGTADSVLFYPLDLQTDINDSKSFHYDHKSLLNYLGECFIVMFHSRNKVKVTKWNLALKLSVNMSTAFPPVPKTRGNRHRNKLLTTGRRRYHHKAQFLLQAKDRNPPSPPQLQTATKRTKCFFNITAKDTRMSETNFATVYKSNFCSKTTSSLNPKTHRSPGSLCTVCQSAKTQLVVRTGSIVILTTPNT